MWSRRGDSSTKTVVVTLRLREIHAEVLLADVPGEAKSMRFGSSLPGETHRILEEFVGNAKIPAQAMTLQPWATPAGAEPAEDQEAISKPRFRTMNLVTRP